MLQGSATAVLSSSCRAVTWTSTTGNLSGLLPWRWTPPPTYDCAQYIEHFTCRNSTTYGCPGGCTSPGKCVACALTDAKANHEFNSVLLHCPGGRQQIEQGCNATVGMKLTPPINV